MVKKTKVPAGQPEVTTQRRGILSGAPRSEPGLCATVLSTGRYWSHPRLPVEPRPPAMSGRPWDFLNFEIVRAPRGGGGRIA